MCTPDSPRALFMIDVCPGHFALIARESRRNDCRTSRSAREMRLTSSRLHPPSSILPLMLLLGNLAKHFRKKKKKVVVDKRTVGTTPSGTIGFCIIDWRCKVASLEKFGNRRKQDFQTIYLSNFGVRNKINWISLLVAFHDTQGLRWAYSTPEPTGG